MPGKPLRSDTVMISPRLISAATCRRRWPEPAFRLGILPARLADRDDARVMLVRDEPRAAGDVRTPVATLGAGGGLALGEGHGGLHYAEAGALDDLLGHQFFDDLYIDPLVAGQELHARGAHGVLVAVGVFHVLRGGAELHHDVGSGGDGLAAVVGQRVFAESHDDHPSVFSVRRGKRCGVPAQRSSGPMRGCAGRTPQASAGPPLPASAYVPGGGRMTVRRAWLRSVR